MPPRPDGRVDVWLSRVRERLHPANMRASWGMRNVGRRHARGRPIARERPYVMPFIECETLRDKRDRESGSPLDEAGIIPRVSSDSEPLRA